MINQDLSQQTQTLFQHHLQCFQEGDMQGLMEDYSEESTVFTPEGVAHGKSEIEALFRQLFQEALPPGKTHIEFSQQRIENETIYLVWHAESPNYSFPLGTDTFVVRGGKIVVQTFAAHKIPKPNKNI